MERPPLEPSVEQTLATTARLSAELERERNDRWRLSQENERLKRLVFELSVKLQSSMRGYQVDPPEHSAFVDAVRRNEKTEREGQIGGGLVDDGGMERMMGSGVGEYRCLTELPQQHDGAVYAIRFSPTGKILASGSFDEMVGLWSVEHNRLVGPLPKVHQSAVVDLSWSSNGKALLSGSLDGSAVLWDVEKLQMASQHHVPQGFVLSVKVSVPTDPNTTPNLFYVSDSHKRLIIFDKRQSKATATINTTATVNAIDGEGHSRGGNSGSDRTIVTGDVEGVVKFWDTRVLMNVGTGSGGSRSGPVDEAGVKGIRQCLEVCQEPLSSVHVNGQLGMMAVNGFDNILRLYSYSLSSITDTRQYELLHQFWGPKFKNNSIKCSTFGTLAPQDRPGKAQQEGLVLDGIDTSTGDPLSITDVGDSATSQESLVLLATGSIGGSVYLYDVRECLRANDSGGMGSNRAIMPQKLTHMTTQEGVVYDVAFHPTNPILASSGSHRGIKLWGPSHYSLNL